MKKSSSLPRYGITSGSVRERYKGNSFGSNVPDYRITDYVPDYSFSALGRGWGDSG